jgi:hypothetical protein
MPTDAERWPKLDAVHVSIGVGLLYVFGFIVANVHFGKYELPRVELLRARYLAAALLFVLCSAIPFATGAFLSRALRTARSGDGPRRRDLKLGETEAWAMGPAFVTALLLAIGIQALLISEVSLSSFAAPGQNALYFIAVTTFAWQLGDSILGGDASDDAQLWPSIRIQKRVINACLWVILVPAIFSVFVYGSIRPELGGGAVWKAQLSWRATVDSTVRSDASGIVAIVDRDDRTVSVLACAPKGPPVPTLIPLEDVASIRLGELVSASSFLGSFADNCRRLNADPKPFAAIRWKLFAFSIALTVLSLYLLYRLAASARQRAPS